MFLLVNFFMVVEIYYGFIYRILNRYNFESLYVVVFFSDFYDFFICGNLVKRIIEGGVFKNFLLIFFLGNFLLLLFRGGKKIFRDRVYGVVVFKF